MLATFTLLSAFLSVATAADDDAPERIAVPGAGYTVELPKASKANDAWSHIIDEGTEPAGIDLTRPWQGEAASIAPITPFQPDLGGVELDEDIIALLGEYWRDNLDGEPPKEWSAAPMDHGALGQVLHLSTIYSVDEDLQVPVNVAVFNTAGRAHAAVAIAGPERSAPLFAELLGMIVVTEPPVPAQDFKTGSYAAAAGYTIQIPEGLRALTEREIRVHSTDVVGGDTAVGGALADSVFLDPGHLDEPDWMFCSAHDYGFPLEVLDPAKAPVEAENFRKVARTWLKGGKLQSDGEQIEFNRFGWDGVLPRFEFVDDGQLGFLTLGEREGYLWSVDITDDEAPLRADLFYTAWDDLGLLCGTISSRDATEWHQKFADAAASVRVVDGAQHPMKLSYRAQYVRWWPFSHPALQLYWLLPIGLVFGIWLAFRGD